MASSAHSGRSASSAPTWFASRSPVVPGRAIDLPGNRSRVGSGRGWPIRKNEERFVTIRIGINGFGRMGRLALRAAWGWPGIEFVHINEVKGGAEAAAHLLNFDSIHGRWRHEAQPADGAVVIDGKRIGFTEHARPGDVPWKDAGV